MGTRSRFFAQSKTGEKREIVCLDAWMCTEWLQYPVYCTQFLNCLYLYGMITVSSLQYPLPQTTPMGVHEDKNMALMRFIFVGLLDAVSPEA